MNRLHRLLLDPSGADGGNPAPDGKDFDVNAAVQQLIAKHGNADRALGYLIRDNQGYRKKNADLKAKVPAEGSVVLSGDDARAWADYSALGKAGDVKASLQAALADRDRFKGEADGLRRESVHKQAAEILEWKPSVLGRLATQDNVEIEVKEQTVNGKPARVALVKAEVDGKPVETKLADYAEQHWPEFLPSLSISPPRPRPGTPPRADGSGPVPARTKDQPREPSLVNF